jgi:hypothetical protein
MLLEFQENNLTYLICVYGRNNSYKSRVNQARRTTVDVPLRVLGCKGSNRHDIFHTIHFRSWTRVLSNNTSESGEKERSKEERKEREEK